MSYRKIHIGDKTYEYVVGRSHVKIKGVGSWPREQVGVEIERKRNKYAVTPAVIAGLITNTPPEQQELFVCEHNVTTLGLESSSV